MKSTYLILLALVGIFSAHAQKPDRECQLKLSEVDSLVKRSQYDNAWIPWSDLRKKCPAFSEKIYTTGVELIKFRIDRVPADQKERGVQELLKLYDDYNKYFPNNPEPISLYKAMAMDRYKYGTSDEIYALLDKAFTKSPSTFKDVNALHLYLKLYVAKAAAGDKSITPKHVLAKRDAIGLHVAKLTAEAPGNAKANERFSDAMDRLVADYETCESLGDYYGQVFEARKSDTVWLSVSGKKLLDKQCVSSPLFKRITDAQQQLKPTAQSAYNTAVAAFEAGNLEDAAKYFNQSAELSKDPEEKAATYFTLASMVYVKDKPKVKEYVQKALAVKPAFAKGYILLAQLYAESAKECGANEFEKKALNWLAAETLKKAVAADPRMTTLDKAIKKYESKAPTAEEIRNEKMGGKTIAFGCWINESVTVPKS